MYSVRDVRPCLTIGTVTYLNNCVVMPKKEEINTCPIWTALWYNIVLHREKVTFELMQFFQKIHKVFLKDSWFYLSYNYTFKGFTLLVFVTKNEYLHVIFYHLWYSTVETFSMPLRPFGAALKGKLLIHMLLNSCTLGTGRGVFFVPVTNRISTCPSWLLTDYNRILK